MSLDLKTLNLNNSQVKVYPLEYKFISSINDVEITNNGLIAASVLITREKDLEKMDHVFLLSQEEIESVKLTLEGVNYYYSNIEFVHGGIDVAGCFQKEIDPKQKENGFFYGNININELVFVEDGKLKFDDEYSQLLYGIPRNISVDRLLKAGCYRVDIIPIDVDRSYIMFEHHCSFVSASRELVVVLVNNKKIEGKWLVPKYFVYNKGDGYAYNLEGEILRVLYNDNANNIYSKNLQDSKKIRMSFDETASVIGCTIAPERNITKQVLFKSLDEGQLVPLFTNTYGKSFFVTLNRKKNRKYGIIQPKE